MISRGNKIVLEEGMVLALEPAEKSYHIQDMMVVRAHGSDKFNTE